MDRDLLHALAILVPVLHGVGIVAAVHAVMKTRTSQGAIAWAFALICFPYLALPFYFVFGRDRFMGYVTSPISVLRIRRSSRRRFAFVLG